MISISKMFFSAILLQIIIGSKSELISNEIRGSETGKSDQVRKGREFFHSQYTTVEEEKKPDYPTLTYPPSSYPPSYYPPIRDGPTECPQNPLMPMLGSIGNFLLLKLGAIGIIKAITALLFLGFLVKLPIFLIKLAFLKSFFLPVLMAPLLLNYFSNQMMPPMRPTQEEKPTEPAESAEGMGRKIDDLFINNAWESVKMLAHSDKCFERIACVVGAYNNDTVMGTTISRMLKFLQVSSPTSIQDRVISIREAFKIGNKGGFCSPEEYKCESPHLLLQHGSSQVRVM